MAHMTFRAELSKPEAEPFVTVHKSACGAGRMVLALVKVAYAAGHNPADKLFVQCIDVDRVAALMFFIQLTLWHVPAEIVVGNTLTLETREVWHIPAYHLGFWTVRLKAHWAEEAAEPPAPEQPATVATAPAEEAPKPETLHYEPEYEERPIEWRGQALTIRYSASRLGQETAHLEILSPGRKPHPISETGYWSHVLNPQVLEEAGGPKFVAQTVQDWIKTVGAKTAYIEPGSPSRNIAMRCPAGQCMTERIL